MRSENLGADDREEAERRWRELRLLDDPELIALAHKTLSAARGSGPHDAGFPFVAWNYGKRDTYGGHTFAGALGHFILLLVERSKIVAPKGDGWVIEPVTNPTGRRTAEATLAVHALFLDCDGSGTWDRILATLRELDLAHVAYQSGGHTTETPKWRLALPLAHPHDTSTEEGKASWREAYLSARVVFGALAGLANVGFDPATDTCCCPWFLTEKRAPTDPEREICWYGKRALDLTSLLLALPPVEREERATFAAGRPTETDLDEDARERLVAALADATAHVPGDRRALYLALPGVLLDRGLTGDDVVSVCEEVSARYPRHHPEKHADNVHCARTTVSRWGADGRVTRIGTLQEIFPHVAAALDAVLPNPLAVALAQSIGALDAPAASTSVEVDAPQPAAPELKRSTSPLARDLAPVAARLRVQANLDRRIEGVLLEHVLCGIPLDGDAVAAQAARVVGYHAPASTSWRAALDLCGRSLAPELLRSEERLAALQCSFLDGQLRHQRTVAKKVERISQWHAGRTNFFDEVKKGT